jgi:hypothetical protein
MRAAPAAAVALAAAALAGAAGAATPAATGRREVPKRCPAPATVRTALHQKVSKVKEYAGPVAATTMTGMGMPPASAGTGQASGFERTCTYSGVVTEPISVTYVSPVTAKAFASSRAALTRSTEVVNVGGLGGPAWSPASGGVLFVLRGTLDIVISAPTSKVAELKALATGLADR